MGTTAKVIIALIIFNVFLASFWVINGNLFFHTDIARDFLLMEDIVDNKNPTLIGPRSGAIPGLFHGPLWLYLNLPSFLIGGGNPIFVGWFWVILYISSLLIIYYVGKKIFSKEIGLLCALLLSAVTILNVRTLFNPYGALILTPLYFYSFVQYLKNQNIKTLMLALFILGLIIQFQMAFGVPVLILTILYLFYFLFKKKKLLHIGAIFILIIPLSSFILFDLRNNLLQVKSVISFIFGSQTHGKLDLTFLELLSLRIKEVVSEGLGIVTGGNIYLSVLLVLFFIFVIFKLKKEGKSLSTYLLIVYFYLGFWLFTLFFKGPVWNYYFLPFAPLLIILFVSFKNYINKFIFYALFIFIYVVNVQAGIKEVVSYNPDPTQQDASTWKFNEMVAKNVFEGEENEFGYFIFTPDLYGYSPRYALNFYQKQNLMKRVYPYSKREIIYLVIAPPPEYGKDPNSIWYQKNINSDIWKSNDVRITGDPASTTSFKNGFVIEKYHLSDNEIKDEPNPYLIKDIFFR